tara:strand:- start:36 stop:368 length:333 start_codon:yes stop_codon:yes gene_type:complete
MSYIPDQGDIIWLNFDPSAGIEMMKRRPALVLSKEVLNEHVGLAIVSPITSTVRGINLEVVLPEKLKTKGAVLVYQLRSVDYEDRQCEFIERIPNQALKQVLNIAQILVQ